MGEGDCVEETITVNLQGLLDKFVKEDCPKLMATLELPDEPIPLWWTADFINGSAGECWKPAVGDQKWVVGEFNCSCVGISKCLAAYCKSDTPNVSWKDIPAEEAGHATKYGDIVGKEAAGMLGIKDDAPKEEKKEEEKKEEAPKEEEKKEEAPKEKEEEKK